MAAKKAAKKAAAVKAPGKVIKVQPANKLTAFQVDILCLLHSTGRQYTADEIKAETGSAANAGAMKSALDKLKAANLVVYVDHNEKWKLNGIHAKAMKTAVDNLRVMGGPVSAGELGYMIWGDPKAKAKDEKANTRYFAAASALLKSCFNIGVLYKMEQDGVTTGYGAVA